MSTQTSTGVQNSGARFLKNCICPRKNWMVIKRFTGGCREVCVFCQSADGNGVDDIVVVLPSEEIVVEQHISDVHHAVELLSTAAKGGKSAGT